MNHFSFLKSPQDINLGIAQRVKFRRKEQKITQQMLSKRANVSLGSIKRFEQTGEISLSSLIKIAFALGYESDFDALFEKKSYKSIEEVLNERR